MFFQELSILFIHNIGTKPSHFTLLNISRLNNIQKLTYYGLKLMIMERYTRQVF
ncbi:hypothetical protein D3C77_376820 [compost metagenome]